MIKPTGAITNISPISITTFNGNGDYIIDTDIKYLDTRDIEINMQNYLYLELNLETNNSDNLFIEDNYNVQIQFIVANTSIEKTPITEVTLPDSIKYIFELQPIQNSLNMQILLMRGINKDAILSYNYIIKLIDTVDSTEFDSIYTSNMLFSNFTVEPQVIMKRFSTTYLFFPEIANISNYRAIIDVNFRSVGDGKLKIESKLESDQKDISSEFSLQLSLLADKLFEFGLSYEGNGASIQIESVEITLERLTGIVIDNMSLYLFIFFISIPFTIILKISKNNERRAFESRFGY